MEATIKGSDRLINGGLENSDIAKQRAILNSLEYLASTDWVEPYLIKHYMGIELLPPQSNKFVIEQKRKEARDAINAQN